MTDPHTPTTEEVRNYYGLGCAGYDAPLGPDADGIEEFNRWLKLYTETVVDAAILQASERAWDRAVDDLASQPVGPDVRHACGVQKERNPYRHLREVESTPAAYTPDGIHIVALHPGMATLTDIMGKSWEVTVS